MRKLVGNVANKNVEHTLVILVDLPVLLLLPYINSVIRNQEFDLILASLNLKNLKKEITVMVVLETNLSRSLLKFALPYSKASRKEFVAS